MLKTFLILAALADWDCRALATFAGIVAIDRDMGVSRYERSQKTLRSMNAGFGSVDLVELKMLEDITSVIYSGRSSPAQARESVMGQCMAVRGRPGALKEI